VNASPNFADGKAQNLDEANLGSTNLREFIVDYFRGADARRPPVPVPMDVPDAIALESIHENGVRFIWLGHSTVYLELDGTRVLVDPVWSDRASPFRIVGPKRTHPMPMALADLPTVDVVVISHDHYDHLDPSVVRELAPQGVTFAVPLGIGADLEVGERGGWIARADCHTRQAFLRVAGHRSRPNVVVIVDSRGAEITGFLQR
jgi:hypothetical protein